ncbi:MAG: prenyltransferase/squalene oxidase repeat-containing protein [Thermoplasmata archaeon]
MSSKPAGPVLAWLLEPREPAMRYLASRHLLRPRPSPRSLERLRAAVPRKGWASAILARQREKTWWATKRSCYVPKYRSTIWQLQVLADLGLSRRDERVANAVEFWFDLHYARDGGYDPSEGKKRHGHLCTTGNMVRSLIRLGYLDDERVQSAVRWLVDEQLPDGGWDCFGRKRGTIDAWEAMSAFADLPPARRSPDVRRAIERGAEFFLDRRLLHEGEHFRPWYRLRYPWHYHYNVLVGLDFLSALGYGRDPRMAEALAVLRDRRQEDGRWLLDRPPGDMVLEKAQEPSKMITFLALRVGQRVRGHRR